SEAQIPCYLDDQAIYDHIVGLWENDRIRPMLGNLLDEQALAGVGDAARELEIPIRVTYLSNAEQYWRYTDQFRANIEGLHFDDKSVVIRTIAFGKKSDEY